VQVSGEHRGAWLVILKLPGDVSYEARSCCGLEYLVAWHGAVGCALIIRFAWYTSEKDKQVCVYGACLVSDGVI